MSDIRWIGRAQNLAHIRTYRITNFSGGDKLKLEINAKFIEVEYDSSLSTTFIEQIVDAWNASDTAEIAEITAAVDDDDADVLVLTHDTPGWEFELTTTIVNANDASTVVETTKGSPAVDEVQKIELLGTPSGGTFTMTYDFGGGNETTSAIAYNASASTIKSALEALTSVTVGDLSVTGAAGGPWYVTWGGTFAATEVPEGTIDGSLLTGTGEVDVTEVEPGRGNSSEVQRLEIIVPSSGNWSFKLNFGGSSVSVTQADTVDASTIQTKLESLATIGSGNVNVYGGEVVYSGSSSTPGYAFFVVFAGDLAGTNVGSITGSDMVNAIIQATTISNGGQATQNEIQLINLGVPSAGTWGVSFGGESISGLAYDISADDFEVAIEALSTVNNVEVYNGGLTFGTGQYGILAVEFQGTQADTNVAAIELDTGSLTVESAASVTEIRRGEAGVNQQWSIIISGSGGTFTLSDGTDTTSAITFGASAATLKSTMETDLGTITTVTVTGTGAPDDPYLVTVTDPAQTPITLTGDGASLTGGDGNITEVTSHSAAVNEVQTVTIDSSATGGQFRLGYEGEYTAWIAYDETSANVKSFLEALSNIPGVSVSGSAGGPYTVTFDTGALAATDVSTLVIDGSRLELSTSDENVVDTLFQQATGENWWDNEDNWDLGRVPEFDDNIYFDQGDIGALFGIRQWSTFSADASTDYVTFTGADFVEDQKIQLITTNTLPAGLSTSTDYYIKNWSRENQTAQLSLTRGGSAVNITDAGTGTHTAGVNANLYPKDSFEGEGGLPETNVDGDYHEYRPRYIKLWLTEFITGGGDGGGSPGFRIDHGAQAVTLMLIQGTGTPQTNEKALSLKGTGTVTEVALNLGSVGLAPQAGDSFPVTTLRQGFQTNEDSDTDLYVGEGASIATMIKTGGDADVSSPITTSCRQSGGEMAYNGDQALAQLYVQGGEFQYNSTGTLGGNTVVSGDGHLDFSQDLRTKTVTNPIDRYGSDSKVSDPYQVVTGLIVDNNETDDLENLILGRNIRITRGAVA